MGIDISVDGSPPAPEPGATRVRSDSSTVLAQVFTQPFTVFSAKKFPGVPRTFFRLSPAPLPSLSLSPVADLGF